MKEQEVIEMSLNEMLQAKEMTKYQLAKLSGVPKTTILDIFTGKRKIENCTVKTIHSIALVLETTVENILSAESQASDNHVKMDFENFKSTVCHEVKSVGDISFLIQLYESNDIRMFYEKKEYARAFYLLAMADYLSRENDVAICADYDDIRANRLTEILYPASVRLAFRLTKDQAWLRKCREESIPEFMKYNIVESEVRNVI